MKSITSSPDNNRLDNDSVSSEEALNELLGLTTATLKTAKWDEDEDVPAKCIIKPSKPIKSITKAAPICFDIDQIRTGVTIGKGRIASNYEALIMERAYHMAKDSIEVPPVMIVNLTEENQGNVLVAKRGFRKGEVIFSEKSIASVQQKSHKSNIRACEMCFRSLESGLCLSKDPTIPYVNLWPVREISMDPKNLQALEFNHHLMQDCSSGVVFCNQCTTLFCSRYCAKEYTRDIGNCCTCKDAIDCAIESLSAIDTSDNRVLVTDPVYILATRMFCMMVHRYRSGYSLSIFDGNCGHELDVTPLRLGDCDESGVYSMFSAYELISESLSLTVEERLGPLSLSLYHKLAAIAQRNGIHLSTLSPFRGYYDAIICHTGGRLSPRQKEVTREIAKILGASDGKLSKDMDRVVEERVSYFLNCLKKTLSRFVF